MHWHGWGMGWMWLVWVPLLLAVVFFVVWLAGGTRTWNAGKPSAEDILKERYARGEIEKEEYERRLKDLRS